MWRRAMVRAPNVHHPVTRLVVLENTHNFKGGRALPLEYLVRAGALCRAEGLALHCDGARCALRFFYWELSPHLFGGSQACL